MKLVATVVLAVLAIGSTACEQEHGGGFATYQECFKDHFEDEMLPVKEAIVVCCLEHPISDVVPVCGETKPDCINYLTANLSQTSASTTDVMDACADYVSQKSM